MKYLFVFLLVGFMDSCGDDATGDVDKQTSATLKQPNCDEIEGIEDCDRNIKKEEFKNYTGIIKCCKKGKIKAFITLKDGKPDGEANIWYENGQIQSSASFKDGIPDGGGITWYENGQMEEEANYKDGEVNGLQRQWYENGQLESEVNFKDGKRVGLLRMWHKGGKIVFERNYKDGEIISEKCYDMDGNEIECPEK